MKDKRYILSALTRRASDRKERLELLTHNVDELLKTTAPPKAPYDVIDPLLVAIHDGTTDPMSWVRVSYNDYPLFFLRDATQLKEFLSLLSSLKLIEIQDQPAEKAFRVRLSLDGWDRVADLRKTGRSRSRAFVAMSFSKDLDTIYDEGIKPALIGAGYTPIRLDTDLDDVHFDTRQYNHIVWRDAADFREQLHTRVLATVHAPVS